MGKEIALPSMEDQMRKVRRWLKEAAFAERQGKRGLAYACEARAASVLSTVVEAHEDKRESS